MGIIGLRDGDKYRFRNGKYCQSTTVAKKLAKKRINT